MTEDTGDKLIDIDAVALNEGTFVGSPVGIALLDNKDVGETKLVEEIEPESEGNIVGESVDNVVSVINGVCEYKLDGDSVPVIDGRIVVVSLSDIVSDEIVVIVNRPDGVIVVDTVLLIEPDPDTDDDTDADVETETVVDIVNDDSLVVVTRGLDDATDEAVTACVGEVDDDNVIDGVASFDNEMIAEVVSVEVRIEEMLGMTETEIVVVVASVLDGSVVTDDDSVSIPVIEPISLTDGDKLSTVVQDTVCVK